MSQPPVSTPRSVGRVITLWVGCLVAVLIPIAAWLTVTGAIAGYELRGAAVSVKQAQAAVGAGDVARADEATAGVGQSTSLAAALVNDPIWRVAGHAPLLGATFQTVSVTADALNIAVQGSLEPLASATEVVRSGKLRRPDGAVDLPVVESLRAPTAVAAASTSRALRAVDGAPIRDAIGPVRTLATHAQDELAGLRDSTSAAATGAAVLPPMLGAQGTQRYFVAFTSPAEARGTGGFLGTYGILRARNGSMTLEQVGANTDLRDFPKPVVDLGPDYKAINGDLSRAWSGMNLSPHFPFAAKQWIAGWKKQTGEQLQGAMAIDPAALSYMVAATKPITLPDGRKLAADKVVSFISNGVYLEFEGRNEERKKFQVAVAKQVVQSVLKSGAGQEIAAPLARAASERRLLVYSTDDKVQKLLRQWPISGTVDTRPGPFAMAVVNNAAGNKADYYLQRTLRYESTGCSDSAQDSRITFTVTNDMPAPAGLPSIITARADDRAQGAAPGSTRIRLEILLPMDSWPSLLEVNGRQTGIALGSEAGRPAVILDLELPRGKPVTTTVDLSEPVSTAYPRVLEQPLSTPQTTEVAWSSCTS